MNQLNGEPYITNTISSRQSQHFFFAELYSIWIDATILINLRSYKVNTLN